MAVVNKISLLIGFVLIASSFACKDRGFRCSYLTSFCSFGTFAKYWCPKTCGRCDDLVTVPPTDPPTPPPTEAPTNPPTEAPVYNVCGKPEIQMSRVVSGKNAVPFSWPWQILLVRQGYPSCGGAIVSPYWIITAAHCIDQRLRASAYSIRVGDYNLRVREGPEADYAVRRYIVHPGWNTRTLENDIALLELHRPIKFNKYISPVCLPKDDIPVGSKCYITGWGKITHPGSMHSILQQASMPVVSNYRCNKYNFPYTRIKITPGMVCAGHGGSTDVSGCHGDSGGPFVCENNRRWELHGAVSHGSHDCSAYKAYSVFTRVNYYMRWIERNMGN